MSIQSEIDRLKDRIAECYEMVDAIGTGEYPMVSKTADYLPSAIASLVWASASTIITVKVPDNANLYLTMFEQHNLDTDPYGTLWAINIDWGDGATTTINHNSSSSLAHYQAPHTYTIGGNYSIKVTPNAYISTYGYRHAQSNVSYLLGSSANQAYLKSAIFDEKVNTISTGTFSNATNVGSIVCPNTVAYGLENIMVNGDNLRYIRLPNNNVYVQMDNVISNCPKVEQFIVPPQITSFYSRPFYNCVGMKEVHFQPTTPPILMNNDLYNWLPSGCVVYVPRGSLEAYQTYNRQGNRYPNPATYYYVEE